MRKYLRIGFSGTKLYVSIKSGDSEKRRSKLRPINTNPNISNVHSMLRVRMTCNSLNSFATSSVRQTLYLFLISFT